MSTQPINVVLHQHRKISKQKHKDHSLVSFFNGNLSVFEQVESIQKNVISAKQDILFACLWLKKVNYHI